MSIKVTLTNRQHGTEVQVEGDDAVEAAETYMALVDQFKGVGGYKAGGGAAEAPAPKGRMTGEDVARYKAIAKAKAAREGR